MENLIGAAVLVLIMFGVIIPVICGLMNIILTVVVNIFKAIDKLFHNN